MDGMFRTDLPLYIMYTIEHEDGTLEQVRRELDLTYSEALELIETGYLNY